MVGRKKQAKRIGCLAGFRMRADRAALALTVLNPSRTIDGGQGRAGGIGQAAGVMAQMNGVNAIAAALGHEKRNC